jgi:hypothetical protein
MTKTIVEPELCSQQTAARRLGRSLSTIKRMLADNELTSVKVHDRIMIIVAEIEKLVNPTDHVAGAADDLAKVRCARRVEIRCSLKGGR